MKSLFRTIQQFVMVFLVGCLMLSAVSWTEENQDIGKWVMEIAKQAEKFAKELEGNQAEIDKNISAMQKHLEGLQPEIEQQVQKALALMEKIEMPEMNFDFDFDFEMPEIPEIPEIFHGSAFGHFKGETVTDRIDQTFDVAQGTPLIVDTSFSSLSIEPATDDSSRISIQVERKVGAETAESAKDLMNQFKVEAKQTDEGVELIIRLESQKETKKQQQTMFHADVLVKVPVSTPIHVSNSFGDVKIKGIQSEVSCDNKFGATVIEQCQGMIDAKTQHGQMKIRDHVGKGQVQGKFGNVTVDNWTGELSLFVEHGKTLVAKLPDNARLQGNFKFGEVSILLPATYSGHIEAMSKFGEIQVPEGLRHEKKMFNQSASGQLGAGDGSVQIQSEFSPVKIKLE